MLVIYVGSNYITFDLPTLGKLIPPFDMSLYHAIILGSFLAFYAFIGFEDMVNISLIKIKLKDSTPKGIRSYPIFIPVIAVMLNITMLLIQLFSII